jgi:thymidylate kinase
MTVSLRTPIEEAPCPYLSSATRLDWLFPAEHWKLRLESPLTLEGTREIYNELANRGYRPVGARQFSDAAFLIFARSSEMLFQTVAVPVPFTPATNALLRSPRGLLLAIFGPDGVGKSSVLSGAAGAIAPMFEHHRSMRWRPQLVSSRIAREAHKFRLPHSAGTHSMPLSMAKLAGAFLDFCVDHATLTRNQLRGCSLITWDRYFHDLAIDTKRYRYDGPAWYPEFLVRHFPVPVRFVGIVLDADEEVILLRKAELPLPEIRRQLRAYRQLADLPRIQIVKNDRSLESTIGQVLKIVIDAMADWLDSLVVELLKSRSSDVYADAA